MTDNIDKLYVHRLISKNLKRLRSQQGISQMELSQKADLTHNFINDIENCKKGISIETLAKLSTVLNVAPYQFFLPDDVPNDERAIYVNDFKNSFQNAINQFTDQYLRGDKKEN